ncbi:TetR family transcriptional regulator [Rhodococcus sp. BGS-1C]|uniref:TetR/AcrR family transcriptional regulator n=1 Tax=unclassified Rhodococcus (in: high G+C Gram-positive bacteria) TaxID=192944 RepID=UPI0019D05B03|nr:TetR/AcrR family transcriptional regulator [Rhodococcus sp. KRD197]
MTSRPEGPQRRDGSLSKERIVAEAIDILDSDGESGLTFRALAARLATGSGAIYWHVANKSELLSAAADDVVARATSVDIGDKSPRDAVRDVALGIFDAMNAHPWIGGQLSLEPWQPAITRILEGMGGQLEALGVPETRQFDAATALVSFIMGLAVQYATVARILTRESDRTASLTTIADRWKQLDPDEYPFTNRMARHLPEHDDREQFLAGIDLILAGIVATQ